MLKYRVQERIEIPEIPRRLLARLLTAQQRVERLAEGSRHRGPLLLL